MQILRVFEMEITRKIIGPVKKKSRFGRGKY